LMKASPQTIKKRVKEGKSPFPNRHASTLFQTKDTEIVLERFEEQYEESLISKKFVLDTTSTSVQESLTEFKKQIKPFITSQDRLRLLTRELSDNW